MHSENWFNHVYFRMRLIKIEKCSFSLVLEIILLEVDFITVAINPVLFPDIEELFVRCSWIFSLNRRQPFLD
jgi:hypothetical protein